MTTAPIRSAPPPSRSGADVALIVAGYTHADEGEYIPPDIFAAFVPSFPPPGPEDMAFVRSMQAGNMDPGLALGGDRERLTLNPRDEALIQAVTAANPKTVVAVMAGSAVIMEAWRSRAAAILMLWYPGMEGGHALADVLTGRVNPSGRLPCVFPARAGDLPAFDRNATEITYDLWHGYRKMERDGAAPAFPFGFGLSYARFAYANLRLTKTELSASGVLEATVEVMNASDRAGRGGRSALRRRDRLEGGARAEGIESLRARGARARRDARRAACRPGRRTRLLRRRRRGLGGRADRLRRNRRPPFPGPGRAAGAVHGRLNAARAAFPFARARTPSPALLGKVARSAGWGVAHRRNLGRIARPSPGV